MTSLLEKALSIIAPHRCIICSNYNNVVCLSCVKTIPKVETPACVLCGCEGPDWRVCARCGQGLGLTGVWVAGIYDGILKQLVRQYKFEHARAAHIPLAAFVATTVPFLDKSWVVTSIPTVHGHIRARSFDHATLLAQEVAQQKRLFFKKTLLRKQNVQQVGSGRLDRFAQARAAFTVHPRADVRGKNVVIVDDVCTTGATLSAAADVLRSAGAKEVWGAVAGWKKLE